VIRAFKPFSCLSNPYPNAHAVPLSIEDSVSRHRQNRKLSCLPRQPWSFPEVRESLLRGAGTEIPEWLARDPQDLGVMWLEGAPKPAETRLDHLANALRDDGPRGRKADEWSILTPSWSRRRRPPEKDRHPDYLAENSLPQAVSSRCRDELSSSILRIQTRASSTFPNMEMRGLVWASQLRTCTTPTWILEFRTIATGHL